MARRKRQSNAVSDLERTLADIDASIVLHEKQLSDLRALRLKLAETLALAKTTPIQPPRLPTRPVIVTPRANPDDGIMGWYSHCDRKWY